MRNRPIHFMGRKLQPSLHEQDTWHSDFEEGYPAVTVGCSITGTWFCVVKTVLSRFWLVSSGHPSRRAAMVAARKRMLVLREELARLG